jgi:hypothetical protein
VVLVCATEAAAVDAVEDMPAPPTRRGVTLEIARRDLEGGTIFFSLYLECSIAESFPSSATVCGAAGSMRMRSGVSGSMDLWRDCGVTGCCFTGKAADFRVFAGGEEACRARPDEGERARWSTCARSATRVLLGALVGRMA